MCFEFVVVLFLFAIISKSSITNTVTSIALNDNLNKTLDSSVIKDKQVELYKGGLYNPLYTFYGDLTGYAGDCALCTGYLACPPRTNVLKEGIYHNDKTYGTVRIAASSKNFPCGTIIRFNVPKLSEEPIIAIILDRGVPGNDIDLLTDDESYAIKHVGRVKQLSFDVLREGWD